jgi:hypothetical protein
MHDSKNKKGKKKVKKAGNISTYSESEYSKRDTLQNN